MSTPRAVSLEREYGDPVDLPTRLERLSDALTAPDIAKLLGMGRTVVYEMAATARIPHFRIGTMIRFDPVQVAHWLREREIGSAKGGSAISTRGASTAKGAGNQRQQSGRTAA